MDLCLAQSSSERFPPAADGSGCREPHSDIIWREFKQDISISSLPMETGELMGIKGGKIVGFRGDERHQENTAHQIK